MEIKLFEIRDKGTYVPVMCTRLAARTEKEQKMLSNAGFGQTVNEQKAYVIYTPLDGSSWGRADFDPYTWTNRTQREAHKYIRDNWEELENNSVIDVEFILKETEKPKESQL